MEGQEGQITGKKWEDVAGCEGGGKAMRRGMWAAGKDEGAGSSSKYPDGRTPCQYPDFPAVRHSVDV